MFDCTCLAIMDHQLLLSNRSVNLNFQAYYIVISNPT